MICRRRRRNWLALQLRTRQRQIDYQQVGHSNTTEQLRIQRKLAKYRQKYLSHKTSRIPPWGKVIMQIVFHVISKNTLIMVFNIR